MSEEFLRVSADKGYLELRMKLEPVGWASKSGKSKILATTNGFKVVEGSDVRVSVNVIRPK